MHIDAAFAAIFVTVVFGVATWLIQRRQIEIQRQVAEIQKQQAETSARQFRLALFEKRMAVYNSTMKFLTNVTDNSEVDAAQ